MGMGAGFERPGGREHDQKEDGVFDGREEHGGRTLWRKDWGKVQLTVLEEDEGIENLMSSTPQNRGWVKQTVARNAVCPESFPRPYPLGQLRGVPSISLTRAKHPK